MNDTTRTGADRSGSVRRRPGGPHPGIVGAVCLGLFLASLILMATLGRGSTIGSPFANIASDFYAQHGLAVRLSAMLQLGSCVPLGIYAATMCARLQRQGARVPGPLIALFGGISASVLLAFSAVLSWTAGADAVAAQPELTRTLGIVAFGTGGFAHLLGLGMLVAGVAVPSLFLRLMPAPLAWAGLVVAALCELSILTMAFEPIQTLIPIGRFTALTWVVAAGFVITRTSRATHTPKETS